MLFKYVIHVCMIHGKSLKKIVQLFVVILYMHCIVISFTPMYLISTYFINDKSNVVVVVVLQKFYDLYNHFFS